MIKDIESYLKVNSNYNFFINLNENYLLMVAQLMFKLLTLEVFKNNLYLKQ